ncbi:hypothetical protein F5B19DRAFT_448140 [Rostrohypoxylon terebratum]|nr:hypothetical protein F5B19DRAFT_448140 [Rostrohypoxylon terebratum]
MLPINTEPNKHSARPYSAMSHPTQTKLPERSKSIDLATQGMNYLRTKRTATYLEPNDLAKLKVECTEIDFDTGISNDEGPKVLDLRSFDEMDAFAKANNLINNPNVGCLGEYSPGNWYAANYLGEFFVGLVDLEPQADQPTLLKLHPWNISRRNCYGDVRDIIYWRIIFHIRLPNGSRPCTVSFLANEGPLQDDKLLLSEVFSILLRGNHELKLEKNCKYQIAPVTVVSASGRRVRIVQGYADGSKDRIVMRKSRIIDVDGEKEQNLQGLMRLACWVFGSPLN